MGLLNFTPAELLALLGALSALVVAFYLYDRSRGRRVVSALWLWPQQPHAPMTARRRKIRQPLSLLLQLLALVLLLLAAGDFWIGEREAARRYAVILDTSAWMAAQQRGGPADASPRLIDAAKQRALAYLRAVPASGRVLLIRAAGAPAPAATFTSDRETLRAAVEDSQPAPASLDLSAAFALARDALRLAAPGAAPAADNSAAGEVVFIGSGRVPPSQASVKPPDFPAFRWISVGTQAPDAGIRMFSARRDAANPRLWEASVEVYSQTDLAEPLPLRFLFEGRGIGAKDVQPASGSPHTVRFRVETRQGGLLRAEIAAADAWEANNAAEVRLPAFTPRKVALYSPAPELWRPWIGALPLLEIETAASLPSGDESGKLFLFDRRVPVGGSLPPGIYIAPPPGRSPVPSARVEQDVRITQWSGHPLTKGLRSEDAVLARTQILSPNPDDAVLAECPEGPVIVLNRDGGVERLVIGFDLAGSPVSQSLAAPLLFANAVGFFAPEVFRQQEIRAAAPGLHELPVETAEAERIQVVSADGAAVPWTHRDGRLRFFWPRLGEVAIRGPASEWSYSLTLPSPGEARWTPPQDALRGVPPPSSAPDGGPLHLWRWLAAAAALCLAVEWGLYGRGDRRRASPRREPARPPAPAAPVASSPGGAPATGVRR